MGAFAIFALGESFLYLNWFIVGSMKDFSSGCRGNRGVDAEVEAEGLSRASCFL